MTPQYIKLGYDIAVSGYACKLPQATSPAAFWEVLTSRRCVITETKADRWSHDQFLNPDKAAFGTSYTFAAGQLDDIWGFDPGFFGISPREAVQMDPQQRILLQAVWEAVEHAGLTTSTLSDGKTGVYIGASASDHSWRFLSDMAAIDSQFMTGNTLSIISNRISYLFDLKGPSFTVDTACSSSFYAMHQAVQSLRAGEIDTAIVGGVNALLQPAAFVGFSRATMLSPEGLCKAFDSSADGYVRSEGAVAFVLRRMDVAQDAGDPVRSVLLGSGVNSDGRTVGMAMPSPDRQADLLRQMMRELQFDADDLAFLEAHGTGTPVGDPMEATAIGEVFGRHRASPLPIGSAKSNFGHLEPASGLVGLLKAQMALEKGVYPASLHVNELNPNIPFDDLNLEVAVEPVDLAQRDEPWLAGVNSFGFGGANAHVMLRQPYDNEHEREVAAPSPRALTLSAASEESLTSLVSLWRDRLTDALAAEAATLINNAAYRREALDHRLVALGDSGEDIAASLSDYLTDAGSPAVITGKKVGRGDKTAFLFGGNGSQWAGMGLTLYEDDEVFRKAFDEVSKLFAEGSDIDLSEQLVSEGLGEALAESSVAQPILFAVQVALVKTLAAQGLRPDAVAGHSVGEVAAAWCAGILTLPDAVHLIRTRSTALEVMRGTGGMAAVLAGVESLEQALAEFSAETGDSLVSIAADNSPRSSTIAGPVEALKAFTKFARKRRVAAKLLDIDYPYHSAGIDPIRGKLIADLSDLKPQSGHATYVSSTSGRVAPGVALDTEYWWRNARQQVQFREAVDALAKLGCGVFVEIAPRPVLQNYVSDTLSTLGIGASIMQTLEQNARVEPSAASIAGRALTLGAKLDFERYFGEPATYRGNLPSYPWRNSTYRIEQTSAFVDALGLKTRHPLLGARLRAGEGSWRSVIDVRTQPWLKDHQVDGAVVFPAAGFLEMALAVGCEEFGLAEVAEFEILRPMVIDEKEGVDARVSFDASTGAVRIESRRHLSEGEWGLNAFGVVRKTPVEAPATDAPMKGGQKIATKPLYQMLDARGLAYGPAFRRIKAIRANDIAADAILAPSSVANPDLKLDPTSFDAAMHAVFPLIGKKSAEVGLAEGTSFLPVRIGLARLYNPGAEITRAEVRLTRLSARGAEAEIDLIDASDAIAASITGLRLKAIAFTRAARRGERFWRQAGRVLADADHRVEAPTGWADPAAQLNILGLGDAEPPEPDVGSLLVDALSRRLAWDISKRFADKDGRLGIPSAIDLAHTARPLLARAMLALEEDGVFETEDLGVGILAEECPYPPVDELILALTEEAPDRVPDLMALLQLEGELPKRLTDGLHEAPVPATQVDISPAGRAIWKAIETAALDAIGGWPQGRRLEILMIGAPPISVIDQLCRQPGLARLTVTDAEEGVVEGVKQRTKSHPCLRVAQMEDVLSKSSYDLVLVGDGLARLGDDQLGVVVAALSSGGLFLAAEPAPDLLSDLRQGVSQDWWTGTLTAEAPIGRRKTAHEWIDVLTEDRMDSIGAVPLSDPAVEASLIFAVAPEKISRAEISEDEALPIFILHDGGARSLAAAEDLEAAMAAVGRQVRVSSADDVQHKDDEEWEAVYLAGLFADSAEDMERAQARIAVVHGLLAHAAPRRLWLITRGGAPAGVEVDARRAAESALWGLGRVLANEPGNPEIRLADFAVDMSAEAMAEILASELSSPRLEHELIFSADRTLAPRVQAGSDIAENAALLRAGEDAAKVLHIQQQGSFDSLAWTPVARRAPADEEVEIEVRATGLNFRDVMWAQGLLPEEALEDGFAGATLGMECSGVVVRAGENSNRSVGDEVIAFGPASFATHMTVAARAVTPLPDGTNFDTAASTPTIFITAQYSLVELARLQPGETVLIHGGAGGVGLAAIQIARRIGARIFATAGSPAKRRMLTALGVEKVFDSRSMSFADEVMAATDGVGVDVVLNSLFGEAMERSIGCLRPFGRFIELGKRDYYANAPIGLRPFRRNLSYFGVDADQLLSSRPEIAQKLFVDLAEGFRDGDYTPPPCQAFHAEEIVDAFRMMQKSGHVGKIIVRPPSLPTLQASEAKPIGDGAWLIIGGLGGFGLATAEWLAEKGVQKLWLTSRSGAAGETGRATIAALRKSGVSIEMVGNDATKPGDVEALFAEIAADGTALKGIIHSAMSLDDQLFASLDPARIEAVMKPKIASAALIDQASREIDLDHFIMYSSVTTLFGNPGQAPYVAANVYLESLAAARRQAGVPGLAVGWGPIADIGYLAREEQMRDLLERRMGGELLSSTDALMALDTFLTSAATDSAITIAPMRWGKLGAELPLLQTPLFETVEQARDVAGDATGAVDIRELVEGLDDTAALKVIIDLLAAETGRILRQSASELDPRRPLTEMGFDSLMAVDLKMAVEERVGANLPLMSLSEGVGLSDLARKLLDETRSGEQREAFDGIIGELSAQHVTEGAIEDEKVVYEKIAQHAEKLKSS